MSLAVIILLIMLLFCRFGRQGSLTVQQLDSEPMPSVKTTAPGSSTVMEVNKSTWVFVGGLGGQLKVDRVALTLKKKIKKEKSQVHSTYFLFNIFPEISSSEDDSLYRMHW